MSEYICSKCGFTGRPKTITKGSLGLEILAWLLFIIPGFIYTMWRFLSRYRGCPVCKAPNMIPVNSPMGLKLAKEFPVK